MMLRNGRKNETFIVFGFEGDEKGLVRKMTDQKCLNAIVSALKIPNPESRKDTINEIIIRRYGTSKNPLRELYELLRDCIDNFRDAHKYTKNAIEKLEHESHGHRTGYIALWNCFTKPEVIADLERWADKLGKDHTVNCEQPWDDDNLAYMNNSEAIVTFTLSKMTLSKLNKLLNKPENKIRFMRKGQRCKVHIGDFRDYANRHYVSSDIANEIADEVLANRETQQKEVDRHKKRTGK